MRFSSEVIARVSSPGLSPGVTPGVIPGLLCKTIATLDEVKPTEGVIQMQREGD